jgi:hypothetical protein
MVTSTIASIPSTSFASNSIHPNYARTPSTGTREAGDDDNNDQAAYPPLNEDEIDTSRVAEVSTVLSQRPPHRHIIDCIFQNLRQWDVAERHRRKSVREFAGTPSSSSMMGDITRFLWPKRMQSKGFRNHVALQSQENLRSDSSRSFDISPNPSPVPSPPRRLSEESHPENPFSNPSNPPRGLMVRTFSDSQDQQQLPGRSSISGPSPSTSRLAGLPSVLMSFPTTNTLPHPPTPTLHPTPIDDDHREGRWWHDWLCGCGEGPDRGGDCQVRSDSFPGTHSLDECQAGRTNPFE